MKQRLSIRDTVLGAVIMLIGMACATLFSPSLTAQRDGIFGEIQCTGLTVLDKAGKPAIILSSDNKSLGRGNRVIVYNMASKEAVLLHGGETGDGVFVRDRRGETAIHLHASEAIGNSIAVHNKTGKTAIFGNGATVYNQGKTAIDIAATELGNGVAVYNKTGKKALNLTSTAKGNGVNIYDKAEEQAIVLVSETGDSSAIILNSEGNIKIALIASKYIENTISVVDRAGNLTWTTMGR